MRSMRLAAFGWWGYFACATIYVIAGVRAGDWFGLFGSMFFLAATIAFILDHYRSQGSSDEEISE